MGRCTGSGARPAPVTRSLGPSWVTLSSVHNRRKQGHLLLASGAAVREVLAECLVFDGVPTDPDAEAELAIGQQVDLGCLLGDQDGLALRKDDDAGHQLERGDGGNVAEEHERLVKGRANVVGSGPALVNRGVRAYDMVVGEQMGVAKLLNPLRVVAHRADIAAQLGLRKDDTDLHQASLRDRATNSRAGGQREQVRPLGGGQVPRQC